MANYLTWLKKNNIFNNSMSKMSSNISLNHEELEFMLTCSIIFLNEYNKDNRKSNYFEVAYYITLKCANNNKCYEPLLDVSSNYGLYPVSKYILSNLIENGNSINDFFLDYQLDKYRYQNIIETYEQKNHRAQLVSSKNKENCYVAPTSFGKSSLIIEIIKEQSANKIAIIVPTKSLLQQTFKLIKSNFSNKNIIYHDEMYNGERNFIAIFTQERALRLLKNKELSFDLLIIDEAHNIFEMDSRSLLLTRLIRRNRHRNSSSINYYLSPLISDADNLKMSAKQKIFERRIINNIKEPDITEYRKCGSVYRYNRFLNEFYLSGKSNNIINYLIENKKEKNFIYLRSPKKVESLASELTKELSYIEDPELNTLSDVISKNVHSDFYCVDYVKKGVIYLHGKLPDLIKEYLEYKFINVSGLKFVIANSVILEGINLPIDNLYILNLYKLNKKSLTNLIGRVNRLNEVFDNKNKSLNKLSPPIHFVNSVEYNGKNGNMKRKIEELKSSVFKDEIYNPLLINFSFDKYNKLLDSTEKGSDIEKTNEVKSKIDKIKSIIEKENYLIINDGDEDTRIKRILMESSISSKYKNVDNVYNIIEERILSIDKSIEWSISSVIDKVYILFIKDIEELIIDNSFSRLKYQSARDYYKAFIDKKHRFNLKEHISDTLSYFYKIRNSQSGREFYIGDSYGEFKKKDLNNSRFSYIDLSKKDSKELVNIALVKIKLESDFISYRLNEFVNILFELGLITKKDYEMHIYGTTNKLNSEFVKIGMSGSLVNKFNEDDQIKNLTINSYGIIECNDIFKEYINKQDDLIKFEVSKFIE